MKYLLPKNDGIKTVHAPEYRYIPYDPALAAELDAFIRGLDSSELGPFVDKYLRDAQRRALAFKEYEDDTILQNGKIDKKDITRSACTILNRSCTYDGEEPVYLVIEKREYRIKGTSEFPSMCITDAIPEPLAHLFLEKRRNAAQADDSSN
jgi:hypothetical protein